MKMLELNNIVFGLILPLLLNCQTIERSVPNCFGTHGRGHKTEVIPFIAGSAFHLKTPEHGIPLKLIDNQQNSQSCAYAFAMPLNSHFTFLSVFIDKIEVIWTSSIQKSVRILFLSDSRSANQLSTLTFDYGSSNILGQYLITREWPKDVQTVYMLVAHKITGEDNNTATLHLHMTLTPTYLCFIPQYLSKGSYVNSKSAIKSNWGSLKEMFHPGWILCSNSWQLMTNDGSENKKYFAYCIDYRFACDRWTNCPADHDNAYLTETNLIKSVKIPVDENKNEIVCYLPSINWLLIAISIFTVVNVILLVVISYVSILRQYSPIRFYRLQARCITYCCCCLPRSWRANLAGNTGCSRPQLQRNSISSNGSEIPYSPPIYESISNIPMESQPSKFWKFWHRKDQRRVFAQSQHHLPPSYADTTEEIGIYPEQVMQTMRSFRNASLHSHQKLNDPPKLKPTPSRNQQSEYTMDLRNELRSMIRQMNSRTRALMNSGLRVVRNSQNHRRISEIRDRQFRDGTSVANPPPPTYVEFIRGDFSQADHQH